MPNPCNKSVGKMNSHMLHPPPKNKMKPWCQQCDASITDQNFSCKSNSKMICHSTKSKKKIVSISREEPPPWCHVNVSKSPSSRRTQVAAVAYRMDHCVKHTTLHKRNINSKRKKIKQKVNCKDVQVSHLASKCNVQRLSLDYIRENIVVCDGGESPHDSIQNLSSSFKSIHYLCIRDGDLFVADTCNKSRGLRLILPGESSPVFIRLPREKSLEIMDNGNNICRAMKKCALTQRKSLARGTNNHVFMEVGNKYCCLGAQLGRAQRGVQSGLYRLKYGFPSVEWDVLHRLLKRAEHAFDMYMDTEIIRHISCAKTRVNFKTMEPSPSSAHQNPARYYNGLGFGINVYLRSHIDHDFTMSIVQAHIDNCDYSPHDKVICYFAFPRIGIAVALRPGDFLLFNPQEPHSISSRCRNDDEIYCISSYLKTGVVGLHDNSNPMV